MKVTWHLILFEINLEPGDLDPDAFRYYPKQFTQEGIKKKKRHKITVIVTTSWRRKDAVAIFLVAQCLCSL